MDEFKSNRQRWSVSPGSLTLLAGQSHIVGRPWVGFPGCIPVLSTCLLPSRSTTCASYPSWGSRRAEPSLLLTRKTKCSTRLAQPSWNRHTSPCWASFRRVTLGLCYKNKNKKPTLPSSPPPKPWVTLLQAFSYVKATSLPSLSACQDSGIRPNVFTLRVMSTCRRSDSVLRCYHL